MSDRFKDHDMSEWAALYALDALPADEKEAFEQYLKQATKQAAAELESFLEIAGKLGFSPAPAEPPASLRSQLMERIGSAAGATEGVSDAGNISSVGANPVLLNQAGLLISRSGAIPWAAGSVPGVQVKPLFVDGVRNYSTALVRMAPGTIYPSHRHQDVEELFLLEGDLLVEGLRMAPGDYCRAEPDSLHGQVRTDAGALFLVLASNANEIVA
jgi:quercetin dioxygenase-like cupin family protein